MRHRIWWAWCLGVVLLAGCGSWTVPINPVPPQPTPIPVPIDPTKVVPYELAHAIEVGQARSTVDAAIGFAPTRDTLQDDGTTIVEWPAVGQDGSAKWLSVQFSAAGIVLGHVLIPRDEPPTPPVASLPDGEIDCIDGSCRITRR